MDATAETVIKLLVTIVEGQGRRARTFTGRKNLHFDSFFWGTAPLIRNPRPAGAGRDG